METKEIVYLIIPNVSRVVKQYPSDALITGRGSQGSLVSEEQIQIIGQ